jgi:hypothetical protein
MWHFARVNYCSYYIIEILRFKTVEKTTIRWIALSTFRRLRTIGPRWASEEFLCLTCPDGTKWSSSTTMLLIGITKATTMHETMYCTHHSWCRWNGDISKCRWRRISFSSSAWKINRYLLSTINFINLVKVPSTCNINKRFVYILNSYIYKIRYTNWISNTVLVCYARIW